MYERMLDKQIIPSFEDMAAYCGENAELFTQLNEWLCGGFATEKSFSFPYGNNYGWCVAHRKKKKLLCNIFAENGSFTVMMRLSNRQYKSVYEDLCKYTREYIDDRYPCGDGGWIHYRVTCKEHFDDIKKLLAVKCS